MDDKEFSTPLIQEDEVFTARDFVVEAIQGRLEKATDNKQILNVLSDLHASQTNDARKRKQAEVNKPGVVITEQEDIEQPEPEQAEPATQTEPEQEQPAEGVSDFSIDDFMEQDSDTTFETSDQDTFADSEEKKEDEGFGADDEFGGISFDMLDADNKALTEQSLQANNADDEQFFTEGYIPKEDYENAQRNDTPQYQSVEQIESEGIFDPDKASPDQIVDDGNTAISSDNDKPKYVVKKDKGKGNSDGPTDGKGVAWLSYILFFIPLLFAGNKNFVRHHANQGLLVNIFDVFGITLIILGKFITSADSTTTLALQIGLFVGIVLELLLLECRLVLIIQSLFGKYAKLPIVGKATLIRSK